MKPYYDLKSFPALHAITANWKVIRDELNKLDAPIMAIDRVGKSHLQVLHEVMANVRRGSKYGWLLGWGDQGINTNWLQYGLAAFGSIIPFARIKMPETCNILDKINGINVCALVKLKANTYLYTHSHSEFCEQSILQFHLTLNAISQGSYSSYLNVDGEFNQNVNGKGVVFDGSLDHFALNASNQDRIILYMEFNKKLILN